MFGKHFFFAAILSLTALVSACQSPGNGYLMNGIGADLPARDIASATNLQRKYFDHLCIQAGLGSDGCALDLNDRAGWNLVVQQGMNDIDRRCDSYLEWLDNQKRNRGPLLSQVSAVQNTTSAIIGFVAPGSTKALNVVLAAFGLLTKSIENYHSRLLLEIESSTINSVVLRARNDFRQAYFGKAVANKPEAEYVLREYLRRCLPFAIETQINDLSTLGSRGIRASEDNSIFEQPVALTDVSRPASAGTRVGEVIRGRQGIEGAGKKTSDGNDIVIAKNLQRALCIPPTGKFSDRELAGIKVFEDARYFGEGDQSRADGELDKEEQNTLLASLKKHACPSGYKNYVESFSLFTSEDVSDLRELVSKKFPNEVEPDASLHAMRPLIERWRDELSLNDGKDGFDHNEATHKFLRTIGFFG